jgi:hypothetical protein
MTFDKATLDAWATTPEVDIETSRGPGAPVHRVTIWIVVDGDNVYVRSVRGPQGRWYREISAYPAAAIHANRRRVPVQAQTATDPATVSRVSDLLTNKYQQRWPGPTAGMLREETLPTTLRLTPLEH